MSLGAREEWVASSLATDGGLRDNEHVGWCRWDIGLLQDLPPGPRFKGPSKISTILSEGG